MLRPLPPDPPPLPSPPLPLLTRPPIMGRYGPFPTAAGDGGGCLPLPIVAAEGALAVVDGAIATAAFVQVCLFDLVSRVFLLRL